MSTTAATTSWLGPFGPGFARRFGREEPAILSRGQRSMKAEERGGLEDDRGTDQPAGAHEKRTQSDDCAIGEAEVGGPFSRSIQDQ
jgi:hypothetical protein